MFSIIEDQLNLSCDLLSRLINAHINSAEDLAKRSRGEVFCLLFLENDYQLNCIEHALKCRGLGLRQPSGRLIEGTIGEEGIAGWRAACALTRRYRLKCLEELAFLNRSRVMSLYRIGKGSMIAIDKVMTTEDSNWLQRPPINTPNLQT